MAYVSQKKKQELAPGIKAVLKKFNVKGTIAVRHHSTLVVNIKQGSINFIDRDNSRGHVQVNPYWIHEHYTGKAKDFLTELKAAMEGPDFFNNDDIQSDYFSRSHYVDINIGSWNKPYVLTP